MPYYHVTVSSMTATYRGKQEGDSEQDAIDRLRAAYRRNRDNRAGWNMHARPWTEEDERASDPYADDVDE